MLGVGGNKKEWKQMQRLKARKNDEGRGRERTIKEEEGEGVKSGNRA